MRRISFNDVDAAHLYELLLMYWRTDPVELGGCPQCQHIGFRLQRFIGAETAKAVEQLVDENPGPTAMDDKLSAFFEALGDSIDTVSDEELIAELREQGLDPDTIAEETRALLKKTMELWRKRKAEDTVL